MNFRKCLSTIFILCFLFTTIEAFSISQAEVAKKNYQFTLYLIRSLQVPVENFTTGDNRAKYDNIKKAFFSAREDYYGRNYDEAAKKYKAMKTELIPFILELAQSYLTRTKELIDVAAKDTEDLSTDFTRDSPFRRIITTPRNPVDNETVYYGKYNERNYHLFRKSSTLESYIRASYETYFRAKFLLDDPEIEYIMQKEGEKQTSGELDYVIKKYIDVITLCRDSKQFAIEIYKVKNVHDLTAIATKYDIATINLDPFLDDRIPAEYKIDALDNRNMVYEVRKEFYESKGITIDEGKNTGGN